MSQRKNETVVLALSLAVTVAVLAAALFWLNRSGVKPQGWTGNQTSQGETASTAPNKPVQEQISAGERLLISTDATPAKQAAVKAIASGNYAEAVSQLEASLKRDRNDPEALIYLNNARIGNQKSYTIAVSVPIGSDLDGAKEILRGVAQAQDEIARAGTIKGTPLKLLVSLTYPIRILMRLKA